MSHLTIDNLEDLFPYSVELTNLKSGSLEISIDLSRLPKCENIKLFLKSNDGSLKNSSIVSQVVAGYEDEDYMDVGFDFDDENISITIGDAIRNPDAASKLEEYYSKQKNTTGKT